MNVEILLKRYIKLIEMWNKKLNLISYKKKDELITNHILDSLSIIEILLLDDAKTILDLGTGCGLPGIPLSIFYPEKIFYLIEKKRKYIMFLKKVLRELKLTNIKLFYGDLRDLTGLKNRIDIIINRGVGDIAKVIDITNRFIKENGKIVFYKGKKIFYELIENREILKNSRFKIMQLKKSSLLEEYGINHYLLVLIKQAKTGDGAKLY